MTDLPHDPTAGHSGFERELSDNSVEYLVFVIDPKLDKRAILSQLETLRKKALELCRDLTKDYIWQRDEFNLELKNEGGKHLKLHAPTNLTLSNTATSRSVVPSRGDRVWRCRRG